MAKRSAVTDLLDSLNDWTLAVDNRLTQTIVYFDFARAFEDWNWETIFMDIIGLPSTTMT